MSGTTAKLKAQIIDLTEQLATAKDVSDQNYRNGLEWKRQAEETRKDFDDLKRRLHEAEITNAKMRGYIERVQEDDIVREDLVTTGEPGGDEKLVPKRKLTEFATPNEYDVNSLMRANQKPRHWITY